MRIGYCVGNKSLMYYIWRLRPPFTNTYLAQKVALESLKDEGHIQKSKEYIANERKFLSKELSKKGFSVSDKSIEYFSFGMYTFVPVPSNLMRFFDNFMIWINFRILIKFSKFTV